MPKKYNIISVANALGLKYKGRADKESVYYYCPFCNDKKGKLNVNVNGRVWRCNKCSEGGGVVHLVQAYKECSREEAYGWLNANPDVRVDEGDSTIPDDIPQKEIADEERLDNTYRHMLSLLTLKSAHRDDLRRRGLNDEAIKKFEFKSIPGRLEGQKIAAQMMKDGYSLEGIPGFYTYYNIWSMCDIAGYLIPFVNVNGKITGLQIRTDNPGERDAKYISFSSTGRTNGTKSALEAHLVGFEGQNRVFITEGALKADIAYQLSFERKHKNFAFLAIPGVNNTKSLRKAFEILKNKGVKTIYNTFDMDRVGNCDCKFNENVYNAVQKIKRLALSMGLEWNSLEWDFEKGIDDYLLFLKEQKY